VKSELKSVTEIINIFKDQDKISLRVINIKSTSGEEGNIVTNFNTKEHYQNNWKTVFTNRQHANNQFFVSQQYKLPTTVNRYAVFENLQEENQMLDSVRTSTDKII
jgi:hypothetical protein